jgi:hypothetical protein
MDHGFGIERPAAHHASALQPNARYLVLIEAAGPVLALMFTEARELVANIDGGAEEVALMTRGGPRARRAQCRRARAGAGLHARRLAPQGAAQRGTDAVPEPSTATERSLRDSRAEPLALASTERFVGAVVAGAGDGAAAGDVPAGAGAGDAAAGSAG